MLSSLPPELLHQIIESTVPHAFHTKPYDDRQRTLSSLSLVSKRFRAIAQPLLHEIVWIKTRETLERYQTSTANDREGGREAGQQCRPRAVVVGRGHIVPSLKHFSLVDYLEESVLQLKQSRLADLLPQLETLNLQLAIWRGPGFTFLQSAAERTLVDCYPYQLEQIQAEKTQVVNLRLLDTHLDVANVHQDWIDLAHRNLQSLISFIQSTSNLPLHSLYLDYSLKIPSILPSSILEPMKELVEVCEERRIRIVYEISPKDYFLDPWISEEFIRRQKEQMMEWTEL
ncbi:hypothetical protein JCM5350_004743 [Sporobolomyces pararoseus]